MILRHASCATIAPSSHRCLAGTQSRGLRSSAAPNCAGRGTSESHLYVPTHQNRNRRQSPDGRALVDIVQTLFEHVKWLLRVVRIVSLFPTSRETSPTNVTRRLSCRRGDADPVLHSMLREDSMLSAPLLFASGVVRIRCPGMGAAYRRIGGPVKELAHATVPCARIIGFRTDGPTHRFQRAIAPRQVVLPAYGQEFSIVSAPASNRSGRRGLSGSRCSSVTIGFCSGSSHLFGCQYRPSSSSASADTAVPTGVCHRCDQ